MSAITITTEEGHEVSLDAKDHAVLTGWPDLNMAALVVVGDEVHARRKSTGKPHAMSLEQLLATVNVPEVLKSPEVPQAAPAPAATPAPAKAPRSAKPPAIAVPVTGQPRGILANHAGLTTSGGKLPTIKVNGKRTVPPKPQAVNGMAKVALRDRTDTLVGFALLDWDAYREVTNGNRTRADSILWKLEPDGTVVARSRALDGKQFPVSELLAMVGSNSSILIERVQ